MAEKSYTSWHICFEYPPLVSGGLGVACAALVESLRSALTVKVFHLSSWKGSSYSASYASPDSSISSKPERERLLGKLLSGEYSPSGSYFMQVQRLSLHVLAQRPPEETIVHAHDWHSVLGAIALKRCYGTPFILHLHSSVIEREGAQARGIAYALEQWGMEEAEKVICVSRASAARISQHYQLDRHKVAVVLNASNPSQGAAAPSIKVKTLLFVGRMCSQKSPELMLVIFQRLLARNPNVRLLMAGDGEQLAAIRQIVDFYKMARYVEILGMVPHDKVPLLYRRADVLCLPSVDEPFGIVAVEAAVHGLSVLMSDRCGAKELLPSAEVLPHRDVEAWVTALEQLILNPCRQRNLAKKVQKEAASRTWKDAANEILALYARVGD